MNKLLEYLERKDSENEKIRMMAIANGDYVYGIEVRFSATLCESDRDIFNKITNDASPKIIATTHHRTAAPVILFIPLIYKLFKSLCYIFDTV